MEIDGVGHDGRADDADRQRHRPRIGQARREKARRQRAPLGRGDHEFDDVAGADGDDEKADQQLHGPETPALHRQEREGDDARDDEAGHQRQARQQGEAERRPQKFRKVGRHGRDLARDPHGVDEGAREALAAVLGEALARDDADLGGEGLKQHGREVGDQHHPEQGIAELRARLDVRREIAGVHIGDGGHHGGACEGQKGRKAPSRALDGLAPGGHCAPRQTVLAVNQIGHGRVPSL